MNKILDRRALGAILGAILGLSYSLITQMANYFIVPDLPLYSDGNAIFRILFGTFIGAFLGFLVNAFTNGVVGILVGSLLGTAGVVFGGLSRAASTSSETTALVALTLLYTFIPLTVLFMPLTGLLRWAAGYYFHEGVVTAAGMLSRWRYLRVILGMIILAVLFGSFVIIPVEGRKMLARMDEYICNARVSGMDNVPTLFIPVVDVVRGASPEYTLEWTDDLNRYPSSLGSEDAPSQVNSIFNIVIARFASGEKIACIFRQNGSIYICSRME
jgi:hypothetical protein